MAHTPKETKTSPQMSAAIADRVTSPRDTTQSFGRIGIPALAAAAEIVKSSRKAEKPFHARNAYPFLLLRPKTPAAVAQIV